MRTLLEISSKWQEAGVFLFPAVMRGKKSEKRLGKKKMKNTSQIDKCFALFFCNGLPELGFQKRYICRVKSPVEGNASTVFYCATLLSTTIQYIAVVFIWVFPSFPLHMLTVLYCRREVEGCNI